jgi:hypothetical protein
MFRIPRYESPMLATPEIPTFLDRRELLVDPQNPYQILLLDTLTLSG